jgi:hypothetical protein
MNTKDEEVLLYRALEALETIADALDEMNERQREKDEFTINHESFGTKRITSSASDLCIYRFYVYRTRSRILQKR